MGLTTQTAWSQPSFLATAMTVIRTALGQPAPTTTTVVTNTKSYDPDPSWVGWFNQHDLVVYSHTSNDGEQVDIVRKGNFSQECYVKNGVIRVRRCGNAVYRIQAEVQQRISVTCTSTPGAQGPKGDTGLQGAKGDTGAQGSKGDTGATGATGRRGPRGFQGPAGANGLDGACAIYSPIVMLQGRVYGGSDTVQHITWMNPGKTGFRDVALQALASGFGGYITNSGIRPAESYFSINNNNSSRSNSRVGNVAGGNSSVGNVAGGNASSRVGNVAGGNASSRVGNTTATGGDANQVQGQIQGQEQGQVADADATSASNSTSDADATAKNKGEFSQNTNTDTDVAVGQEANTVVAIDE